MMTVIHMNKITNIKKMINLSINFILILFMMTIFSINSFAVVNDAEINKAISNFNKEYGIYFNVFLGFVILSNILIFIYHFVRLGKVSTNPQERKKCLDDLFISGVCLSLIGGIPLVLFILFNIGG